MQKEILNKFDSLNNLIGNTPLLKIAYRYKGQLRHVFIKAEHYNYTGSIKDRMAFNVLKNAYLRGDLKQGDIICETTSGNTGISICALGAFLGHRVVIYMPDWMGEERKKIMCLFGGEVRLISKSEGGFLGCIKRGAELASQGGIFLPLQFDNPDNTQSHFLTTAAEVDRQMAAFGAKIDAVVAGVGTGGTIMGFSKYFENKGIKIHPLEPLESPTLSTGYKTGAHRIQGISDEFIPSIVKMEKLDSVVGVSDGDSIIMAKMLSQRLGLGVGVSSGANLLGAVKLQNEAGKDYNVVTVFSDDSKKYLSAFANDEPMREDYLSKDIQLISFESVR